MEILNNRQTIDEATTVCTNGEKMDVGIDSDDEFPLCLSSYKGITVSAFMNRSRRV